MKNNLTKFKSLLVLMIALITCSPQMWGTSAVALTAGEYSMTSAVGTGNSKIFKMCNDIYYGRNGGSLAAGCEVKSGSMIAFKIAQTSTVQFYVRNSKNKSITDTWTIKAISNNDFNGIISQYDATGNAATYYSNAADSLSAITITQGDKDHASTSGYTSVSASLSAGAYGFYLSSHSADGDFVDKVKIIASGGGCASNPTAPTAFSNTAVTNTTATFSITDAGNAASYDLYYASGSPSTPTSGTAATTNVTTKTPTITSLTASTTYKIWVRSVCDGSHKSDWVALGTTSFTTSAAVVNYATSIDFEAFIDRRTTSGAWKDTIQALNYTVTQSDGTKWSLDGGNSGAKPADKGLKIKEKGDNAGKITFTVRANQTVELKVGTLAGTASGVAKFSIDGGSSYNDITGATTASTGTPVIYTYTGNTDRTYVFKTNSSNWNIVQHILIGYKIEYNKGANGTGTIANMYKTHGTNISLSSSTFTRDGYTQDGWSTSDGGDKVYNLGGSYTTDAAITLYPHWVADAPSGYTVTYNASSGSGDVPVDGNSYESGEEVTVLGNIGSTSLTRYISEAPATFFGWNTNSDMYSGDFYEAGDKFEITSDITLYAVWGFNITYKDEDKLEEITGLEPTYYIYGEGATLPTSPTKSGYTFDGWYNAWCVDEDDTGESPCGGDAPCGFVSTCKRTTIAADDTWDAEYYAKWTENSCTDAELAYGTTEVAKTYGDAAFTNTLTNSHSVSVTYSSTNTSVATVDSYGEVTIKAAGNATIKATLSGDATYCDDEVSYTLTVSKADLAGTASTGTASSVTHNSASLPFTISTSTDGIASMTIKVYDGESLAKTYSDITPASSGSYSATDLSASTTYTYTITLIGDANHNDKTETNKSTSFTTGATPTLTALVAGTLYEVPDMIPSGASLTSDDQFFDGLSANTKFELIGSGSSSTTPKVNNKSSNDRTIAGIEFDDGSMWFKGEASLTSNIPTTFGLSFIVPGTGKLYLYFDNDDTSTNIKLAKSGATGAKPTVSSGYAVVDVTEGTYYMYGTGTTSPYSFYGLKFVPTYAITLHDNNGGEANGSAKVEVNGKTLLDISAPTRTGYDVEGYYGEADCTTKIATAAGALQASKSVSDVEYTNSSSQWTKGSGATLYAKWTPAVYTVTLDANGGTINSGNVTEYTYGVGATLPNDVTAPSGSVFLGWYDGSTKVTAISNTATGNKSYKAKYGRTLYDSYFYQTYATTNTSRDDLVANAGFPAYISTSLSGNRNQGSSTTSSVTTPHDFSALGTTSCYFVHGTGNVALEAVADVKTIRIYGFSRDNSKKMSITAKKVSGSGSDLSISDVNLSTGTIVEFSVNIAGASGYNAATYYDYTLSFSSNFCLWGIYVEKYTNVAVTGVSLNKSSTTLTVGDTEQLTATIAPANATNKAVTWTSSNKSAATVSPTGLITAKAEGETTITVTTSDGSYTATCDVTVEAFSCAKFVGKIFELTVTTSSTSYTIGGGTEQNLSSGATIMDDCSAYMGKLGSSTSTSCISSTKLKLDVSSSNDKYAKITPKCALRNGDVISCTGSSQEIAFSTTKEKVSAPKTSSYSYTVTPGDGLAGASTIYVWGATSSATVATLTITRPTSYVLTYNPNGGRDEVEAERMAAGANTLTTDVPTRAGYVFKEWNSQEDGEGTGYEPGALYTMPASASELFAKWVEPNYSDEYAYVILTSNTTANTKNATALIGGLKTNSEPPYQLDGNSDYFGITLATNFVAGDKVQFKLKKGSKDGGNIYKGTTSSDDLLTSFSGLSSGDNIFEIDITAAMISGGLTKTLAFVRTSSDYNHSVYWIKVKRKHCVNFVALKSGVTTWSTNASDWIGPNGVATAVPDEDDVVYLDRAVTVGTDVTAHAKDVILGTSGTLTISSQGTMIAEHTIRKSGDVATGTSDLIIDCDKDHQGALIFENPSGDKQAQGTVNFYTRSYRGGTGNKLQWQYVGYPFASGTDEDYDGYYINKYSESEGKWIVMRDQDVRTINAWEGLAISGDYEGGAQLQGTFAPTTNTNVSLTYGNAKGENLIGNSWTAPIQLADMDASDFGSGATATVYIFNTGRFKNDGSEGAGTDTKGTTDHTVGQWLTIPISSAKNGVWAGMKVIPAFQAFEVITSSATTLSLDYSKVVRSATNTMNAELHAPARRGIKAAEVDGYRIRVADSLTQTDMYLFEDITFTTDFDNGWEGYYMPCDGRSAQLYAQTALGKMAVAALPDLEGTLLGFKPGKSSEYTFSFGTNAGVYYLNDIKTQTSTLMQEGYEYTFTWEDGDDINRFMISATPFAKTTPTGVDKVQGDKVQSDKVRKVLIDDHLYIIRAGKVFDATGGLVK